MSRVRLEEVEDNWPVASERLSSPKDIQKHKSHLL